MSLAYRIEAFNKCVAVRITNAVGTMWCAYAFMALALISLPEAVRGGTAALVAWIAQTCLQLVLLPLIMVGSGVLSEKSEARAKADHQTLLDELALIRQLHTHITELSARVRCPEPFSLGIMDKAARDVSGR